MSARVLAVRGGLIVSDGALVRKDLLIVGERFADVADDVDGGVPTFDASGLVVLPGAIDAHVHFREPGDTHKEDFASGSSAARAGGVTTVLDMPNTRPPTTTFDALALKRRAAQAASCVDFGFYFGVTDESGDACVDAIASENLAGVKVYLAPSTGGLVLRNDRVLDRVFAAACARGLPVSVHAEDEPCIEANRAALTRTLGCCDHGAIRDVESARRAVARALLFAERHRGHLHVAHVSSGAEADLIAAARARGLNVTAEVTPHHLWLDEGFVLTRGCLGKVNPPLRSSADVEALWRHLARGTFDLVATDHAPHLLSEKVLPYDDAPAGLPGVEWMLPLFVDAALCGRVPWDTLVRLCCEGPARVFGIPNKGRIEPGCDADLAIFDPSATRTIDDSGVRSRCGWTPYAGRTLRGALVKTLLRGNERESPGAGVEVRFPRC